MLASQCGREPCLEQLIAAGANLDLQDKVYMTVRVSILFMMTDKFWSTNPLLHQDTASTHTYANANARL